MRLKRKRGKVVIVSQHYPPDPSTTAAIMSTIAEHLAADHQVLVLSGTPDASNGEAMQSARPAVLQIRNRLPAKAALVKRAAAELSFTVRAFWALLWKLQRGDVVLTVPAPFVLPYAVAVAAQLKRANSVLIMHDLYPEVLVMAGLLNPVSIVTKVIRGANALMFRTLSAVVTIGRDTEQLLLNYGTLTRDKIRFIPNWTTLNPGVRPIQPDNPYRCLHAAHFVVGLSGNLGFTHDPVIVFEAARILRDDRHIHFMLSGWGVGFERLKQLQTEENLPNVTLVERVEDKNLEQLLSAADVWIIPYRRNAAGVSVPSRFYNLLAVGRPLILISEPEAEAAITVRENNLGWVVAPDMPNELSNKIRIASAFADVSMAQRAVATARSFSLDRAMMSYAGLIDELLENPKLREAVS
jgi:colanic acid biosynthesis glycosyl transferase WcaI